MRTVGPADNEPAGGRGASSRRTGAWIGDGATMRSAVQAMKASPNAAERRIRFVARRMFFESEPMRGVRPAPAARGGNLRQGKLQDQATGANICCNELDQASLSFVTSAC